MDDFKQVIRYGNDTGKQISRAMNHLMSIEITEDNEVEVIVKKFKTNKTLEQLGYYWGVLIPVFMKEYGCLKAEADEVLKEEVLPPVVKIISGKVREIRPSIAVMTVKDMAEYIDKCIILMSQQGMHVPQPEYRK